MGFIELFGVALIPVLKTLLISTVGSFLALDCVNILGSVARHHLNNLVFYVFSPALVASSLVNSITTSNIFTLWFMPINILLTFIIGSILGWILAKITRTPQHLYGLVIGCCSAGNLGNLLLIIIPAVCKEKNNPFGDSSICSTNGEAYASLSMAIGAVCIWSYVYNIIRAYGYMNYSDQPQEKLSQTLQWKEGKRPDIHVRAELWESDTTSEDSSESGEYEHTRLSPTVINKKDVHWLKNFNQNMKIWAEKVNLKMLFAPATIATIVGLTIAVISPLRNVMVGDNAPLRVIQSSASLLGEATIPAMTLIVGANLLQGLKKSRIGIWVVIGIQMVRYVASPLLGIVIVKVARCLGLVGSDSLYHFVLLLQYALPSAMTVGTITQLFEVGESECSVIMFWNYAVASISLTLWTTYYMWLVS